MRTVRLLAALLALACARANDDWDEEEEHHSEHHHSHIDLDHEVTDDFFQTVGNDEEHLKEHLGDEFTDEKKKEMTHEEERYQFFRVHDTNQDGALDGLELMKSLLHVNPYQVTTVPVDASAEQERQAALADDNHNNKLLQAIAGIIDSTLNKYDWNTDGSLDYTEYISGAVNMFSAPAEEAHPTAAAGPLTC
ncbi:multiple coagulation factor deficiency protein 2 homolog [Pollicipes pollicipes]|uniref:multiple coagulation factor deficiency protein 2 homolog n=1 Tax=Pollicipes pollicipes TaxID=41117 RepID=UPI001885530A|nr:multiple coagulation factor deficiency protein 2 homolog [Pollicipes pollicipes]